MNDLNYIKTIKNSVWKTSNDVSVNYVKDFIETLNELFKIEKCDDKDYLNNLFAIIVKKLVKEYKIMPTKAQLVEVYLEMLYTDTIPEHQLFESMILVKSTRSNSGELENTTALPGNGTSCKYDCAMCPNQEKMPRSYLSSEGTIIQGIIESFDGFRQTLRRFLQYEYTMGHKIDKVLHILLGGTMQSYDTDVIENYITDLYYCCNVYNDFSIRNKGKYVPQVKEWFKKIPFMNHISVKELLENVSIRPRLSLEEEKKINRYNTVARITGIVIETRPDQISYNTMYNLRRYGVTRVQLGIQHTDETVLKIINRQHTAVATKKALRALRDNGFKVDGHLMPNCPGSTYEKDRQLLLDVFKGEDFQLDYCKLYICLDVPYTQIRKWKERAKELPIEEVRRIDALMTSGRLDEITEYVWVDRAEENYELFLEFLLDSIKFIPPWTRLNRFQRDFPKSSQKNLGIGYNSTTLRTNLQQICMETLQERGLKSYDIRSREVRKRIFTNLQSEACVYFRKYRANEGTEFFISVEVPNSTDNIDDAVILGLIRLRIPDWDTATPRRVPSHSLNIFKKKTTLRVRELHVYGNLTSSGTGQSQHKGIGKFLLRLGEYVAYHYNLDQVAIIAGIGVQEYYANQGYTEEQEYMIKEITSKPKSISLFNNDYNYVNFVSCVFGKWTLLNKLYVYSQKENLIVIKHKCTEFTCYYILLAFLMLVFLVMSFVV